MKQEEYSEYWSRISHERRVLSDERAGLETTLSEIKTKIKHLDEILEHLGPLAGIASGEDISKLGITDAIRAILKNSNERMSAQDVRSSLIERGFDLSGLTAPMSSIYKVLSRLVSDSEEVEREREEGGNVFFKWKHPAEISDDDIPF